MNKLADAEIIESFTRTYEQYKEKGDFRTTVYEEILDLIKRKDAEIERLDKLVIYNASCCTRLHKDLFNAKTEAIKEFAERLKCRSHRFKTIDKIFVDCIPLDYIDNIVKEMTEQTTLTKIEHNSLCETETYKGGE